MVVLAAVTGSLLYRRLAHVATVALVFTFAARTHPSRLAITSTTLPSGHFPLEKVSSDTSTKSPICKFLFGSVHSFLSNRVGRYSLVHLRQNKFARYCACLQARLQLRSSLSKTPGGTLGHGRRCNKWLGVNGCSSKGLSLFLERGLELRIFVTSAKTVERTSSETTCSFNIARKIWRTERIIRSQMPPMWLAAGGLKIHSIIFCPQRRLIFCCFHPSMASFNSNKFEWWLVRG